ncbi:MAG: type II toxin-antitoxin system HipA family toxin [Acidobacteriia bacterium]|nr:type II toxin-antitoxin system HipA family toxin [Terriglobia bacterium]MYC67756.1 type II toxin-antitoxin system HipA family toxin [Terriglobia bacterium]
MTGESLVVWFGGRRVGLLRDRPGHDMEFEYEPGWVQAGGFAISQSMPLHSGESTVGASRAHRFFANLLPEGGARERIVRRYRVPDNDFALLRVFGRECAGALEILPEGDQPDNPSSHQYERIDDSLLAKLQFDIGWDSAGIEGRPAPRLSLAGAQDKTAVALFDGQIWLPKGTAPSSHILKFDSVEYSNVLAFECFATLLAEFAGLPVVDFKLRAEELDSIALIKRYDRILGGDSQILRLHQEDFCQAMGLSSQNKYETDGGPSFADCYRLIRDVSDAPLDDLERLLRWQVFNVLAGNSDGHAKNLSLLYGSDGSTRLAPFYDLVPTRAIENLDHDLAIGVGGMRNPGNVGRRHWESVAAECDVRSDVVLSLVEETAESLMVHSAEARARFEETHGRLPALDRVEKVVSRQCQRAARMD